MPARPPGVRLEPVRVVGPGECVADHTVLRWRCASPGLLSQGANRRRRVHWKGRCSLHWRVGFHPRARSVRTRCRGSFIHSYGPRRAPRAGRLRGSPTTTLTRSPDQRQRHNRPADTIRPLDTITKCGAGQSQVPFSILRGFWCSHPPPRQVRSGAFPQLLRKHGFGGRSGFNFTDVTD